MTAVPERELSPREKSVLKRILLGETYAVIAMGLGVTYDTVKTITNRIRAKVGESSKEALAVWAANNPDKLASTRKRKKP